MLDPTPSTSPRVPPPSLRRSGGMAFLLTAAVGRIPAAMIQLGVLLYVTRAGGDLASAGLTVAALGIGTALGAPVIGRLIDRHGPLPVLLAATAVQLLTLLGLVGAGVASLPLLLGLAALLGAANPQVAAIARSRWTRRPRPGCPSPSWSTPRPITTAMAPRPTRSATASATRSATASSPANTRPDPA